MHIIGTAVSNSILDMVRDFKFNGAIDSGPQSHMLHIKIRMFRAINFAMFMPNLPWYPMA